MLKILQVRLQKYMNCELPDVQPEFRKGRRIRDQIANKHWIIEKAREFQKNMYFCFIDHLIAFDYEDHNKLWKILTEIGITDHFTCLLRNLYAGQEATVRTGHGKRTGALVAQRLKHLPAIWETWVRSLGREHPLEKEMATHSSILAWRIPWTEEPGGLQSMGSQSIRQD